MVTGPFLSIVTPCLNRAQYIREAIESVLVQDFSDIEHIVVDGGSTDGTLEILAQYSHLNVISEPDRNLYDALNKGVKAARGEVIGFLNTDDLYNHNILDEVVSYFIREPKLGALVGSATVFRNNPDGSRTLIAHHLPATEDQFYNWILLGPLIFNAWFFRRSVFESIGDFNIQYEIASDRDFILRFGLEGLRYKGVDSVFYNYRDHLGSLTIGGSGDFVYKKYDEYLSISDKYLRTREHSDDIQGYLNSWWLKSTIKAAAFASREFNLKKVILYGKNGLRKDIRWPWIFVQLLVKMAVNKIKTRL